MPRSPQWFLPSSLHTYLLTPWCRVLLEKLAGLQLVKKFPTFHGTRRFFTALTSVRHLSLSWPNPIQSIYPHPTSWRSILLLSTHLRLVSPVVSFPPVSPARPYTPEYLLLYINYKGKMQVCSQTCRWVPYKSSTFTFLLHLSVKFNPHLIVAFNRIAIYEIIFHFFGQLHFLPNHIIFFSYDQSIWWI